MLFSGLFHGVPVEAPLFIANAVIGDYSENRVDTLHMKNLLHLGEDRYLTTLLLKHFPDYKTSRHSPLLRVGGQRRRWINLTVHNLDELVFIQPITVAYVSKQVAD